MYIVNIFLTMEKQDCTALTLIDLSAAFDTIDHRILLEKLKDWFGLDGVAMDWVVSYLKHFSVRPNFIHRANPIKLIFGVPLGFGAWTTPVYYVHYSF